MKLLSCFVFSVLPFFNHNYHLHHSLHSSIPLHFHICKLGTVYHLVVSIFSLSSPHVLQPIFSQHPFQRVVFSPYHHVLSFMLGSCQVWWPPSVFMLCVICIPYLPWQNSLLSEGRNGNIQTCHSGCHKGQATEDCTALNNRLSAELFPAYVAKADYYHRDPCFIFMSGFPHIFLLIFKNSIWYKDLLSLVRVDCVCCHYFVFHCIHYHHLLPHDVSFILFYLILCNGVSFSGDYLWFALQILLCGLVFNFLPQLAFQN